MMQSVEEGLLQEEKPHKPAPSGWLQVTSLALLVTSIVAAAVHYFFLSSVILILFLLVLRSYRVDTNAPYNDAIIAIFVFAWWAIILVDAVRIRHMANTIVVITGSAAVACLLFVSTQWSPTTKVHIAIICTCHVLASVLTIYSISSSS